MNNIINIYILLFINKNLHSQKGSSFSTVPSGHSQIAPTTNYFNILFPWQLKQSVLKSPLQF